MVFSLFLTIFTQKNACYVVLTPKWQRGNIFLLRISKQSEWKLANSNRISFWTCQALLEKKTRGFRFAQYFANKHQGDFGRRRRRLAVFGLRNTLRINIRKILGEEEEHDFNPETKMAKRNRSSVCEGPEKSRTWFCCLGCSELHFKE